MNSETNNMSGLPEQDVRVEQGRMYSADDVQHLVAREVMKNRLDDLQNRLGGLEKSITDLGSKVEAAVQSLMHTIGRGTDSIKECRNEIEKDIAQQYATKLELEKLEGKFNTFAAKIIAGTSVAMVIIQLGFQLWGK